VRYPLGQQRHQVVGILAVTELPGSAFSEGVGADPGAFPEEETVAVDPHENELKVEIDTDTYAAWREVRAAIKEAQAVEEELRAKIEKQMGNATAATVGGVTVITYRPRRGWNTKGLLRDHADLCEHYMTTSVDTRLDVYQFAAHHPDIAALYQTRDFREAGE
jgi:hypothetical protein